MNGATERCVPRTPPYNPGLLNLIRCKRQWHWKPSAEERRRGFLGWHQRGYLPHFDAPNVTQMVTYMLADSFPITRRREWEPILHEPDSSVKRRKLEHWLDRGYGECWLRKAPVATIVESVFLEGSGSNYELKAWVIMPNHVHVVVGIWDVPLKKLVARWKGRSARFSNLTLRRNGAFWQDDYFDTRIRDEDHLRKAIHYTEANPAKACLVMDPGKWPWSSARGHSLDGRLRL